MTTTTDTGRADRPTTEPLPRAAWLGLAVILVAEMLDALDALITSIGAPAILRDLGGGPALVQWLAATYTLAMACGLLIGGRLGDLFGKRRLFLVGMAGFTLGSLLCGLATGPATIIAGRVVQGLLGALMLPQGIGMIRTLFPGDRSGRAFGLFGPLMTIAGIGGPILAGALIDLNPFGLGWRSLFLVNVVPGVAALVTGLVVLPVDDSTRDLSLDWTGSALVAAGMAAIVFPLVEGRELGWPLWAFGVLAGGVALLVLFGLQQRGRARAGRDPLVEPSLFGRRSFVAGLGLALVFFGGTGAIGMVTALYLQLGLHLSPLMASLVTCFEAVGMVGGFLVMAKLGSSRRTMGVGMVLCAAGHVAMLASLRAMGAAVDPWLLGPSILLTGLGIGTTMGPFFAMIISGVNDDEAGSASGALTSVQQISTALGVSTLGSVFFSAVARGGATPGAYAVGVEICLAINTVLVLVSLGLLRFLPAHAKEGVEEGR